MLEKMSILSCSEHSAWKKQIRYADMIYDMLCPSTSIKEDGYAYESLVGKRKGKFRKSVIDWKLVRYC